MSVKAVEDYVKEVSRLAKSGITTEHTFRGALAVLLDQLAVGLKAFNEPKRTDCGAPDYIVQDKTGLGVFYVEAKDLGDGDLDGKKRTGHKEQFDRYKAALDTIIFTDYLDFRLYRHGQLVSSVKIADWDGAGKVSGIAATYDALAELIAEASSAKPQKIESSKRLAELMAGKARLLQRNAAKFLSPLTTAYDAAPAGAKPPVTPILELLIGMRNVLMPDVGADEFSDIFAQTLTYGMFAARLNAPTPEDILRTSTACCILRNTVRNSRSFSKPISRAFRTRRAYPSSRRLPRLAVRLLRRILCAMPRPDFRKRARDSRRWAITSSRRWSMMMGAFSSTPSSISTMFRKKRGNSRSAATGLRRSGSRTARVERSRSTTSSTISA